MKRLAMPVPDGYARVSDGWHLMHSAVLCRPVSLNFAVSWLNLAAANFATSIA
jgi:hypothetical protein